MQKTIYCEEYSRLLDWLKAVRIEQGLTMRRLADRLEVHHSWIGRVELGERRLDVMEFVRYCQALEADPVEGLGQMIPPLQESLPLAAEGSPKYKAGQQS
jgi:transcriptional regulator with XRE-family HTH domain